MKFCSECGSAALHLRIPPNDHKPRFICDDCGTIHYQNPKIIAGCIAEWQGRVLLCRRAIEPRYGFWTLPAGFMETGESTTQAAAREAYEEACAVVNPLILYGMYSLTHISQVYLIFRGLLQNGYAKAGHETLEVGLFGAEEVPWPQIAFSAVQEMLQQYFAEQREGQYRLHTADITRTTDGQVMIQRYEI